MQNLLCENEFYLHENEPLGGMHFHNNGFARRLVLTQRHKVYNICLISISNSVSDGAANKSVLNTERS